MAIVDPFKSTGIIDPFVSTSTTIDFSKIIA